MYLSEQVQNIGTESGQSFFRIDLVSNNGLVIYSNYDKKSIMQRNIANLEIYKLLKTSVDNRIAYNTVERRLGEDEILVGVKQGNGYLDYKGNGWFLIIGESLPKSFWRTSRYNQSINYLSRYHIIHCYRNCFLVCRTHFKSHHTVETFGYGCERRQF